MVAEKFIPTDKLLIIQDSKVNKIFFKCRVINLFIIVSFLDVFGFDGGASPSI